MPNPLSDLLWEQEFIILDGALATYMESVGHNFNNALWSASLLVPSMAKSSSDYAVGIKDITKAHEAYFQAGANIATTATYQASTDGLMKCGHLSEHDAEQAIKLAVRAAQDARSQVLSARPDLDPSSLLVAGSVGPYGAFLANGAEYTGDYGDMSEQELLDFHKPRMSALAQCAVDCFALETVPSFREAIVLAKLLKEDFPNFEAWMSFTLRDGEHIADGTPLTQVVSTLEEYDQIVAIGVNCMPPSITDEALDNLSGIIKGKKPLIAYPNSGEGYDPDTKQWFVATSPQEFHLDRLAFRWAYKGVRIIGGCCRTTPKDIESVKKSLDSLSIDP